MISLGFFGTPELAASVLGDLIDDGRFDVRCIVTNPDKPIGRDQILSPTPVKRIGLAKNIPIYTPERIRGNTEFLDTIASYNCDYFIVVAYGKILPKSVLDIPKKLCINVHGSLLPAYRGASPIQSALFHGETETGVTIMQMSEGMDEGDIISTRAIEITTDETAGSLFEKFAQISGSALIDGIIGYESGVYTRIPQDHTRATYCKKIEKEDGLIDWSESAKMIYHKWQGYTPWPGIYTMYEGKRLLLERVSVYRHREEGSNPEKYDKIPDNDWIASQARNDGAAGQAIRLEDGRIGVICGEGILTLEQVKLEGKKSQNIRDFVNGNQKFISSFL